MDAGLEVGDDNPGADNAGPTSVEAGICPELDANKTGAAKLRGRPSSVDANCSTAGIKGFTALIPSAGTDTGRAGAAWLTADICVAMAADALDARVDNTGAHVAGVVPKSDVGGARASVDENDDTDVADITKTAGDIEELPP